MSEPAVQFSLTFTYEEEETLAVHSVSGTIPKGTCIVLCGGSGCGKSTLLRCINHLIPQFYEGELEGSCQIEGKDLEALSIGETGRLAASVFQDPRSQFFTLNSDTEAAFGLENFGYTHQDMTDRVQAAFHEFHREDLRDRDVFSLSSGERQLTAILSAWAMDTNLLLLDEPTANLDHTAVQQLTETLKRLKEQGKTLLISEHRLYYLKDLADEYWLMEQGTIKARYSAQELQGLSAKTRQALGLRTTDLAGVFSSLQNPPEPARHDHLSVKGLSFRYRGMSKDVLCGITGEVQTGEVLGLIGSNGCGKTTLGKVLTGLLQPHSGTITLNGMPLSGKALSNQSIFIMQEAEFQCFTNSVWNELCYGQEDTEERHAEIERLLKESGLWPYRNRHPFSLSGGQMQRLVMLLACLSSKPIVVLDEPTAGLDYKSLTVCADLIRQMQKDRIILLISHDLELLSLVCTRGVSLSDGMIQEVFDLKSPGQFEALKEHLETKLCPSVSLCKPEKKRNTRILDPRLKLLIVLTAMVAGIGTEIPLIVSVGVAVLAAALYETRGKLIAAGAGSLALIYSLYGLWPSVATSFIASFFPRIILIAFSAALIFAPHEGPRILAGLRAIHSPERVNMIVSVVFRFFPVLYADLSILSQAIKTRGFFKTWAQKLRSAPEYLEILIVPMVFRVLRIAETLSASAETRGIALPGHRESYVTIRWTAADTLMMIVLAASLLIGGWYSIGPGLGVVSCL